MRFILLALVFSITTINLCSAQDSLRLKNETTVGILLNEGNKLGISFQHYTGVFLKDYNIETGLVLGLDNYDYFTVNPIGLALKTTLIKGKKIDTMIGLNTGLGLFMFQKKEEQTEYQPQLFTNPNLSFRFGEARRVKFNFNVGYKIQQAKLTTITPEKNDFGWPQPATKTVNEYKLQRIIFAVGLVF
jgi:hypothetical protein